MFINITLSIDTLISFWHNNSSCGATAIYQHRYRVNIDRLFKCKYPIPNLRFWLALLAGHFEMWMRR